MFRAAISVASRSGALCNRLFTALAPRAVNAPTLMTAEKWTASRGFVSMNAAHHNTPITSISSNPLFLKFNATNGVLAEQPARTVTKFSIRKGKRKSVQAVLTRFKRLDWGGWIRTRCGRHKKIHKKSENRQRRLRQHVLVNSTQAWLLDKMVGPYWRRPRFYVDDPYEPYHVREFMYARNRPIEYWPKKSDLNKS